MLVAHIMWYFPRVFFKYSKLESRCIHKELLFAVSKLLAMKVVRICLNLFLGRDSLCTLTDSFLISFKAFKNLLLVSDDIAHHPFLRKDS